MGTTITAMMRFGSALVTAQGDGAYLATPVYLYMAGHWELRTTIQGSDVTDSVVGL